MVSLNSAARVGMKRTVRSTMTGDPVAEVKLPQGQAKVARSDREGDRKADRGDEANRRSWVAIRLMPSAVISVPNGGSGDQDMGVAATEVAGLTAGDEGVEGAKTVMTMTR